MRTIGFLFSGAALFGGVSFLGGQGKKPEIPLVIFEILKSPKKNTRENAAKDYLERRKKDIDCLLVLAQVKENKDQTIEMPYRGTKELAIELLGKIKAVEAIPFFVKNVSYPVLYDRYEYNPIQGYPCSRALIAIGSSCYPEIRNHLKRPLEDIELKLFAYIIRSIDGHEIGQARLELFRREVENLATVDGENQRKNIDRLLEWYKTRRTGF